MESYRRHLKPALVKVLEQQNGFTKKINTVKGALLAVTGIALLSYVGGITSWHAPALATAFASMIGWMVNAQLSIYNQRRQHSINILFQTRFDEVFNRNFRTLTDTFPPGKKIDVQFVEDPKNVETLRALHTVINYYEFIAIGVKYGDIDEDIVYDCLSDIMLHMDEKCDDYIRHVQKRDPGLMKDFRDLCAKWRERQPEGYWTAYTSNPSAPQASQNATQSAPQAK